VNKHFKTVLTFFVPVFFCVPVSCFCVVVVVTLQPQFSPIRRESLLIFVLFFGENSTGFDVICSIVRLVLSLLCSCRVSLQPQFRHSAVNSPHFCNFFFAKIRQFFEASVSSFALCCASCVVVESHSSHSFASQFSRTEIFVRFVGLAVLLLSRTPATVSPSH
jgi:hypothetical protein